jgi:hypothetical protein
MADGTPAFEIPPGATPIVRSATAAGTIDTVPAHMRWIILNAWISGTSAGTAGLVSMTTTPSFDSSTRTLIGVNVTATAGNSASQQIGCVVSVEENIAITLVNTATSATLGCGFAGYQECK